MSEFQRSKVDIEEWFRYFNIASRWYKLNRDFDTAAVFKTLAKDAEDVADWYLNNPKGQPDDMPTMPS